MPVDFTARTKLDGWGRDQATRYPGCRVPLRFLQKVRVLTIPQTPVAINEPQLNRPSCALRSENARIGE